MRSPGSVRLARLAGLIAVVVWIPATVALAQAPSPDTPGIEAPAEPETRAQAAQAIPLEEVPERAEATRAELDATLPREASRQRLERIGAELDRTLPEVESRLAKTRDTLAARPNVRTLQELDGELSGMLAQLRPWDEELDRQLAELRAALHRLDTIRGGLGGDGRGRTVRRATPALSSPAYHLASSDPRARRSCRARLSSSSAFS